MAPPWTETLAQPIAIEDVIASLVAALSFAHPVDATYEIGGTDRLTYAELMREHARQRGLRRGVLRAPIVTPRVARSLLPVLVPAYGRIAAAMVDSLRNENVGISDLARHGATVFAPARPARQRVRAASRPATA